MSSGTNAPSKSGGLCCAPFGLEGYLHDYKDCLDTERFGAILSNDNAETAYDDRNGRDVDTVLGVLVTTLVSYSGRGTTFTERQHSLCQRVSVQCEE